MNKRIRQLCFIITIMLTAIILLCACMGKDHAPPSEETITITEDMGYGVVDLEDETTQPVTDEKNATEEDSKDSAGSLLPPGTEATEATTTATEPTVSYKPGSLTFDEYLKLSGSEQQAYALSFSTIGDYITWFNTEKEKYENNQAIEITGPVDLNDLTKNSNG